MSRFMIGLLAKAATVVLAVILALQLSGEAKALTLLTSGFDHEPAVDFDFSINIEINGQPFNIPVENVRGRMSAELGDQSIFDIDVRRGWRARGVTEFTTRFNDEPIKIFFFPIGGDLG